ILGGLALAVVEIRRHGDHRFGDRLAEVIFGGLFHFLQHFGADLRRGHFVALHLDPGIAIVGFDNFVGHHADVFLHHAFIETTTDQTLHRVQGVVRVGDRLALGRLAYQGFAIIGVGDDRRRGATTLGVLDNLGGAVFQNRDAGVGSPQVDTDDFTHFISPEIWFYRAPFSGRASSNTLVHTDGGG